MEIAWVLGLLLLALALFASERVSVDLVTLLLLVALVLTGILTPAEAFAGFGSEIIVILASIFVLSGALRQTGTMDTVGEVVGRLVHGRLRWFNLVSMAVVSFVSAFMNNTTVTAVFAPTITGVAQKVGINPSRVLMPVAFASILGGTCTLIGTSTNVAVSGYIERQGLAPVGLFETAPVGIVAVVVGILYMLLVGERVLPDHPDETLSEEYAIREYLSEVSVLEGSPLVGQHVFASELARREMRVLEVLRGAARLIPDATTRIEADDTLLIQAPVTQIAAKLQALGVELKPLPQDAERLQSEDIRMAEALVTAQSSLVGHTLKEADFRLRHGLTAMAIYRHGHALRDKVGAIRLRVGDLLLVHGPRRRFASMERQSDLWILGDVAPAPDRGFRRWWVVAFFAGAVLVSVFDLAPLSIAVLTAAVLTLLTRCITVEEAYGTIDWRLIILIGGMTVFATAMDDDHSGAARFLADGLVSLVGPLVAGLTDPWGPMVVIGGFFLLTIALTQPLSNAAAALVVLPVALETASQIGVNQRSFAIAIMMAASISLITPFEPSCILVYGPGKYRFWDFVKVGLPLTLILLVVILLMVPWLWPLHPEL